MNNFMNVIASIKNAIPSLDLTHSLWYVIKDNPNYQVKVSMPDPFDRYPDIVARVTVFHKEVPIWDILIATDTDLKLFQQKFSKKVKEHMLKNKEV